MTIETLVKERRWVDVFVLARYMYRVGEPIISDEIYDRLELYLQKSCCQEAILYLERTYDDDPVPFDLLKEVNIKPVSPVIEDRSQWHSYLDEEKSFSIRAIRGYRAAYDYFMYLVNNQLDFMASLKMDGINTKMLYVEGKFTLSLSRGRAGLGFDFTENSAKVMPEELISGNKLMKVIGESFVDKNILTELRQKYDKNGYKTCKSAALSMLRVAIPLKYYTNLHTRVFYAEGLGTSLSNMFNSLEEAGIETVPHKLFSWKEIPTEYKEFESWLKTCVMDSIYDMGFGMPSDGCVIEVNELGWQGGVQGQYVSRQAALKFEQWAFDYYVGTITDIKIEQRRVNKSVRVTIVPMKTADDCNAAYINSFNPSILVHNDLFIGKQVYFERNSGAVNILIHGERLQKLLEGDAINESTR